MEEVLLTGNRLLSAFKQGANRVIDLRHELNEINVFPVADSDTGTNLASLMRSISTIDDTSTMSINEALVSIADKSLEGAKGNSGMIFAQYFNGLSSRYQLVHDDVNQLIHSIYTAVDDAYRSVQVPQEGTVLTVMRVWANTLFEKIKASSLSESLIYARQSAYEALQKTATQHKVMKRHGVVDAGAQGFYEFVEGLTDSLIGAQSSEVKKFTHTYAIAEDNKEHWIDEPNYQYCLEVVMSTVKNSDNLQHVLEEYGDSMVLVHGQKHSRIHIHTNQPKEVLGILENYGVVNKIKADDMKQQYFDIYENKESIALVTDSIADLPESVLKQYNVHMIPLTIMIDDAEHLDKVTISNSKILDLIQTKKHAISSSMANQQTILRLLESLEKSYQQVIIVSVSSGLSGMYNAYTQAVNNYSGPLNIAIIDSKLNSLAQGLLVKKAGQYIQQEMEFDDIVKMLEKDLKNIKIYVSVSDLKPMIKSGRIPQHLGSLFERLKLKPIVTLDEQGNGALTNIGFTIKGNQKTIKRKVIKNKQHIDELLVGYTSGAQTAKIWEQYFSENVNNNIDVTQTSAIVALSAGENCTAVAVMYKGEKN